MLSGAHLAAGVRYNKPSDGEAATVWSLSGQYDLSDNLFVRGSAGTAFRLPDAESLYAQDPINNGEVGNPDLKPERSTNFNASVGARAAGFTAELIGFHRETKDLITFGDTPDPDVSTFVNSPDKVTAKGFEAVITGDVSPSVSLQASWTHAKTQMSGTDLQIIRVPKDTGQAVLDIHPEGRPFGGSITAAYTGAVFDNVSSGFGRIDRGKYAVVDLNAWLTFGPDDRHRISARAENLFDRNYATSVNRAFADGTGAPFLLHYRGTPRTFHVTYAYSF
jgi:vitamin B12 transporter